MFALRPAQAKRKRTFLKRLSAVVHRESVTEASPHAIPDEYVIATRPPEPEKGRPEPVAVLFVPEPGRSDS